MFGFKVCVCVPTLGGSTRLLSSRVDTWNSHDSESTDTYSRTARDSQLASRYSPHTASHKATSILSSAEVMLVVGSAVTNVVLSGGGLQHGSEEPGGEGEPRGPEQDGGRPCAGPLADLLHASYEVSRPCSKGLRGGISLHNGENGRGVGTIHQKCVQESAAIPFSHVHPSKSWPGAEDKSTRGTSYHPVLN